MFSFSFSFLQWFLDVSRISHVVVMFLGVFMFGSGPVDGFCLPSSGTAGQDKGKRNNTYVPFARFVSSIRLATPS